MTDITHLDKFEAAVYLGFADVDDVPYQGTGTQCADFKRLSIAFARHRKKAAAHTPALVDEGLRERVARAICCARHRCAECLGSGEGGCFDLDLWGVEADAAIAALTASEVGQ